MRTWSAAYGSIILFCSAMRRIHLSDLMLIALYLTLFDHDLREHAGTVLRSPGERGRRAARHLEIRRGMERSGRGDHRGHATIRFRAHSRIQRQLAEQLHAI